jgi:hypothetical protein
VTRVGLVFHLHRFFSSTFAAIMFAVKHNPTNADIREYFWSLVDKNGPLPDRATGVKSKCWLWLGSVTDQGYGRFKAAVKHT